MNAIRNIVTLQLGILLSCGIGVASLFPNHLNLAVIGLCLCLGYAFISLILLFKIPIRQIGLRSTLRFSTFLVGYILYSLHLPSNITNHIENHYSEGEKELVYIKIVESRRSTNYYHQYLAKVKQISDKQTRGKALVRIQKHDSLVPLEPGLEKLIYAEIQPLPQPVNPFDIDMRNYYKSLGIFHRITISDDAIIKSIPSNSKQSWVLRKKALQSLEHTNLKDNSKQLIQAMVLGYREEWSTDRRMQYSNAGVAHILAISGLHIGLLYLVLFWLVLPLQRIAYTRTPVYLICLVGLWAYAWFTGMSPSATRSVSMLSFFIATKIWQRPAPPLHILGSSYVVLLLLKPEWLFHIGFQMSYSAVFFILWLYPKAIAYWEPKYLVLKRIWQIILISCIAQLGVMPWTLHYFGKIPGLFLLSNLIIFSVLSILLIGGMIILLLSLFDIYSGWHIEVYNFLIDHIDAYINWVSLQEKWILSVSKPSMAISIGVFVLLLFGFKILWQLEYNPMRNLAIVGIVFLLLINFSKLSYAKEEVWLLHEFGESHILQISPNEVRLFTNNTKVDSTYLWERLSDTYSNRKLYKHELPRIFKLGKKTYFHVDSSAVYPDKVADNTVVILQHSTKVNLDRLLHDLKPIKIIADGSNYPSSVLRWKETCIETKTPLIYTGDKGAIILNSSPTIFEKFLGKTSDSFAKIPQR